MTPDGRYGGAVTEARLTLNGESLGDLREVRPDMPWFEARFIPTDAFAAVEPLFRPSQWKAEITIRATRTL
jgi:hypothetical protein